MITATNMNGCIFLFSSFEPRPVLKTKTRFAETKIKTKARHPRTKSKTCEKVDLNGLKTKTWA